jgi:lysophospholipase L1-like esterase
MPRIRGQQWAVASTLLWFLAFWLAYADDGVTAVADRIAKPASHHAAPPAVPGTHIPEVAILDDEGEEGEDGGGADDLDDAVARIDFDDGVAHLDREAGSGGAGAGGGSGGVATPSDEAAAPRGRIEDVCIDGASDAGPGGASDAGPGGDSDAGSGGTADACTRWAMDGFDAAVAAARAGTAAHPVRVSFYGDSVTATDAVPARVRSRLQRELGDGGPGWMWPVWPHRFVFHEGMALTNAGTWNKWSAAMGPAADQLHGVGGATAETVSGTATLVSKAGFTQVELYYLAQPNGGAVDLVVDGAVAATIDTEAAAKEPRFERRVVAATAHKLQLRARGRVRLFGYTLENAAGAVVDNMALVAANVKHLAAHTSADHWASQLAHRDADLVMIMLGANESQWLPAGKAAMAEYTAQYRKVLAPIRKGLPDASCLVLSPLDQAHDDGAGSIGSRPVMPMLVAAQRAAAHAEGCAFWSAYDWAGGKGSAQAWRKKRLVGDDYMHLSRRGANKLGDGIVDALLAGARDRDAP